MAKPRFTEEEVKSMKFGRLTPIEYLGKNKNGKQVWKCKCDCGNETTTLLTYLNRGDTQSCGCIHTEVRKKCRNDLTGKRFGKLLVLERAENHITSGGGTKITWRCRCDCGVEKIITSGALISNRTVSCGCAQKEIAKENNITHGMSGTRLYKVWCGIKQRCCNSNNPSYHNYGGRGIEICKEWMDFSEFEKWAYSTGYDENAPYGEYTIERIDVNGDYCPENCKWVTLTEQSFNRRDSRFIEHDGKSMVIRQWSNELGIPYAIIRGRSNRGDSLKDIIKNPEKERIIHYITFRGERKSIKAHYLKYGFNYRQILKMYKNGCSEKELQEEIEKQIMEKAE